MPNLPPAIQAAYDEAVAAKQRDQDLERQYDDALTAARQQQSHRQGRTSHAPGAVIVEDDRVTSLHTRWQAARVAATEAEKEYRKLYNLYLTRTAS